MREIKLNPKKIMSVNLKGRLIKLLEKRMNGGTANYGVGQSLPLNSNF